ncbi:ankyrin repeat domain-containing protein [Wolbachia endosymbiont (group B) of Episyrphus balteatus]|uniref:ankyrin repeat domain-containing protein n=1 Tax=Wolbachia endosymbiont (group B) of Episyrphus balteatus TaxID=2954009 RepID=UPI002227CE42|nr:ankyrin repeat domain-containing protein [Wolbachia endosymbiont (group B) of Episyrphus balteatus]
MGWNLLGGLMPPAVDTAEERERRHSRDSGAEEEFEVLEQEEIKEHRHSGDSGNCSEVEEGQNTNRAIELEFQLTQSLLSQVKAGENNRNANSGKQAQLDLERMDFLINGQTISKAYVHESYCQHNHLISSENANYRLFAKQVFTEMFKYAKAETPNDNILEELITNCNQAGYDGSLLMQLSPIFSKHKLSLPHANDRKISIVYNSQGSLNIQYCPSMPVRELDTNKEICRVDAILEFTLKFRDSKVEYENGKVTLAIPEQLENYKVNGKSLLDEINRHFEDEDNRITETLEKNMNEGPKSFAAEDLSITESSSDSSEVANKVVTDPGILGNVANVLVGVAEVTAVVATELFWPQDQVNIEPRHNEEEFTIIPENLTFDGLIDVINKAKNYGDYTGLDKTINNIEESDRFITDLNCGNLKDFCSQQLNLTDHTHNVLLNNSYDETNGYYNHSVKELSLLAIAANDTLVERYAETHKSILFTQDEELDRLLIGVGGQCYIKFLLEHLDKPNHTMFLDGICKKLERASFVGNQKCVEVILNRFKNTEAEGRIIFSSKLLHYAIHLAPESKAAEVIVNRKVVDINSIDNSGIAPLHYAVARDNFKLISLLIENGANVDVQDERHGRTALHWAAYHDKFEIVKLLVNKGADWNIKDRDGKTALDLVGTKSLYLVREENREKSSSESKITKFLEGLDDKTPLHLNIKKDPEFKNIDNQRPQRSIVDKGENIMNNEKASIEEAMDNNYRRGKMPGNEKIIGEKLSNAVDRINLTGLIHLLKKLEVSTYEPTVQKLLDQANDKITNLEEGEQKEALEQIILFLENELKHTAATLPVDNNVEAAASSQEALLVESKESSPSLSSEEDDFSKLEGNKSDCSAGTSSDSNSNSPFEKISEEGHETRISVIDTVEAEATANGTVSSNSVPCTLRVELTSDDEDELLSIEIEDVNNDINVNQPTEHVEQVANGNGQPKTELPRINEQSSKSGLKKNPQNTKKYVVAASALAIAGIVSGVAVAVYLEMLAVGIAVAACCLIAATVTYCCRPKSLIENGEPAEIVFKERSVY